MESLAPWPRRLAKLPPAPRGREDVCAKLVSNCPMPVRQAYFFFLSFSLFFSFSASLQNRESTSPRRPQGHSRDSSPRRSGSVSDQQAMSSWQRRRLEGARKSDNHVPSSKWCCCWSGCLGFGLCFFGCLFFGWFVF